MHFLKEYIKKISFFFPNVNKQVIENIVYLLLSNPKRLNDFLDSFDNLKRVKFCQYCNLFTETSLCEYCEKISIENKNNNTVCIVSFATSFFKFNALNLLDCNYFSLNYEYNLKIAKMYDFTKLNKYIKFVKPNEIILGINATPNGVITKRLIINNLVKIFSPLNFKITELSYGIPIGAEINIVDKISLKESIINRKNVQILRND